MTGVTIMLMMLGAVILGMGPRIWQWASHSAGDRGPAAAFWHLVAWLMALGFGAWAVRAASQAIPAGDPGWGGIFYLLLAIPVFGLGMAAAIRVMLPLIARIGAGPTLSLALVVLTYGLIEPMRAASGQEAAERRTRDLAAFEHNLEQNRLQLASVAHAPPDQVPAFLDISTGTSSIEVTNRESRPLRISIARVLPHGRQWRRCWLAVPPVPCSEGSADCDGRGIQASRNADTRPVLAAGETRTFVMDCPDNFGSGRLEFRASEPDSGRPLFQSDSAFVPDVPDLGG